MNRNEINKELRRIESKMTQLYQTYIRKNHYVTGQMYASTQVKLINGQKDLRMEVKSTPYFPIVDANYGISKAVMKSAQFKSIKKQLISAYSAYCKSEIIRLANK